MSTIAIGVLPVQSQDGKAFRHLMGWHIVDGTLKAAWQSWNGLSAAWNDLQNWSKPTPAVNHVAVGSLASGLLQLWVITPGGALKTASMTGSDPGTDWTDWSDWPHATAALSAVSVAPLMDGRLQIWGITRDGKLKTAWQIHTNPTSGWSDWHDHSAPPLSQIAAAPMSDGRLQAWIVTKDGKLKTSWQKNKDPSSTWSNWSDWFHPTPAVSSVATCVARDRRPLLWVITQAGVLLGATKKSPKVSDKWTDWSAWAPQPTVQPTDVTAAVGDDERLMVAGANGPPLTSHNAGSAADPNWTGWSQWPISGDVVANWTTELPHVNVTGLRLAYGKVWTCVGDNTYGYYVQGYDHLTGGLTTRLGGFSGEVREVRPFQGGLLAWSDGRVYVLDPDGEKQPVSIAEFPALPGWSAEQAGTVYLYARFAGLWRVPATAENLPPNPQGQILGGVGANSSLLPILGPGAVFLTRAPNLIDVLDPLTLAVTSTIELAGTSFGPSLQGICNSSTLFVIADDTTVSAIDMGTLRQSWQVKLTTKLTGAITADDKYCYVSADDGRTLVLDAVTGNSVWQIELGVASTQLVVDGGVVYAASGSASAAGGVIFAADPQSRTVARLQVDPPSSIIAAENGVAYYFGAPFIGAARLADLLREFYAESVLIQDIAFTPGQAVTKKPVIHTEITLYEPAGSPWALQTIRVGSTSPAVIESGGRQYNIGPASFADLKTDGAGRVRVAMAAGDNDSHGNFQSGLSSPALTLFTSFMTSNERILVRPDAQLHDALGTVTKERLQQAKAYDGSYVVNDGYRQNDAVMTNVAGMLGATSNLVKNSLENRNGLLGSIATRYLAPGCDRETICCCKAGDYDCKLVCRRAFAFDVDPSSTSFAYLDGKAAIEAWLRAHPTEPGPLMSWGDFWDKVKQGAAKVKNAIVYAARMIDDKARDVVKTLITAVIDGVHRAIEFVVDTVEHAIALIQGVFNEIAGGIAKVLETLSHIFDWEGIKQLKNTMKANIGTVVDQLLEPGPGGQTMFGRIRQQVDGEIGGLTDKIDAYFGKLIDDVGTQSGSSVQDSVDNKGSPAKGGATSNWLQAKLQDNLLSEHAVNTRLMAASPVGSGIDIPAFTIDQALVTQILGFLDELKARVTDDIARTIERVKSAFDPSSGTLFAQAFKLLLELVRDAVGLTLNVFKDVIDAGLKIAEQLLRAAWAYIRDQKIIIPYVSDFYRQIVSGDDLTPLDLACLVMAVPAFIALKVLSGPADAVSLSDGKKIAGIIAGVSQIVWGTIRGILGAFHVLLIKRLLEHPGKVVAVVIIPYVMLGAAFGLISRGLFLLEAWESFEKQEFQTICLWLFPTLAVLVDVAAVPVVMAVAVNWPPTWKKYAVGAASALASLLIAVTGALQLAFAAWAKETDDKFTPLLLTFNVLVGIGLISRGVAAGTPLFGSTPQIEIGLGLTVVAVVAGFIIASGIVKVVEASVSTATVSAPRQVAADN